MVIDRSMTIAPGDRCPPHDPQRDLRLACQTQVLGDIQVTKYDGFWGQGTQPLESPSG